MKNIRTISQNIWLGVVAIILISLVLIQTWNVPRVSLANTIEPSQIIGPIYRGEFGTFDQFYISYKFTNDGGAPVEITQLKSKILINGTNYNSYQITHGLVQILPGSEGEIIRIIQLSQSPIRNVEGQRWNITAITEISATSSYSLFEHKRTITEITTMDWDLHVFE